MLVSACLLGLPCRYDCRACPELPLQELGARGRVLSCCPEVLGGLGVPRPPAEIVGGDGQDVLEGRARERHARQLIQQCGHPPIPHAMVNEEAPAGANQFDFSQVPGWDVICRRVHQTLKVSEDL